jgi:prepilin-type N-terminal cleavage/methylation domain-containing protein
MGKKGFTLIELLIVIAIILILIAIALPNFLEAQIRARVTKASAEIRSLTTAFEAYRTDWPYYPRGCLGGPLAGSVRCRDNWGFVGDVEGGASNLTSPVNYIAEIPDDLFAVHYDVLGVQGNYPEGHPWVKYRTSRRTVFNIENPSEPPVTAIPPDRIAPHWKSLFDAFNPAVYAGREYLILSLGPDKNEDAQPGYTFDANYQINGEFYSPTNGTKSSGDIIHLGP